MQIGSAARGGERCAAGDVALAVRPGRSCSAKTEDAEVSLTALPPAALQRIIGDPAIHGGAPGFASPPTGLDRMRQPRNGKRPSTT